MTSIYGPVTDWATDFDHAEPNYNANAPEVWAELRETCPVAHTDRYNGAWLPVTHELVTQIAYDTEHFTSRSIIVNEGRPLAGDAEASRAAKNPGFQARSIHGQYLVERVGFEPT